jgi:hypothetical protein
MVGFEQEGGREKLGFPGVEVLKPQGFKKREARVRFQLDRPKEFIER